MDGWDGGNLAQWIWYCLEILGIDDGGRKLNKTALSEQISMRTCPK